jgi:hypothetical protein
LAELGAEKRGTAVDLHTVHAAEQQPHGATEFGAHLLRSTREEVWSALNLGTMAAQSREAYCKTTDQRLSDPRPPLPHAHNLRDLVGGTELGLKLLEASSQSALRDLLGLGSAALRRVPEMGAARPEELVKGNDPRLTNARTPEAHQHSPEDIMGFRQGYLDIPVMAADPEVAPAGRARLYATTTGELRMSIDGAPYRLV